MLDDPEDLEEYFIIERETSEPSSEGQLSTSTRMHDLPPELEEQIKIVLKAVKKWKAKPGMDKRKRDEVYSAVVKRALAARLSQYPTSIDEDEVILERKDLGKRQRMAVEVRIGEKRLLLDAGLVQCYGKGIEEDQERPEKKVKRDR